LVLRDHCVSKIPWIIDHLIKLNINNLDDLIISFIRNLHCGDFSERINKLSESTFNTFKSNFEWLLKQSFLLKIVFMKLMRLYSGYCYFNAENNPQMLNMKNSCFEIIVEIWKNKKEELYCLGRELIRILQDGFKRAVF
jgi:Integrator complex subunit 3 N-terminal